MSCRDVVVRPAVSSVGGDGSVVPSLANLDAASLGLAAATSDDVAFSLDNSLGLSETYDADRFILESGLLSSPDSSALDDDNLAGHSGLHQSDFDLFDFIVDNADFVAASDNAAADHEFTFSGPSFETQISPENPIQQPQLGASSIGCDADGIAVGLREMRGSGRDLVV
jgi:transcriptional activator HAC1